ncbi:MAG: YHYH domain-containing protein [Pseudomonadales bacterium]
MFSVTVVSAHSGGTDARGCHAGKKPYHCHTPKR